MTSLIKSFILSKLETFFDIDRDRLKMSLLKMRFGLNDLALRPEAVMEALNLPPWLRIKSGRCGELKIKVPLRKCRSKPVTVHVADLLVEVEIAEDVTAEEIEKFKHGRSEKKKETADATKKKPEKYGIGGRYGIIDGIVDGVRVQVENVRISFAAPTFTAKVDVSSVAIASTTPDWKVPDSLMATRVRDKGRKVISLFKLIEVTSVRVHVAATHPDYAETMSPLDIDLFDVLLRATISKPIKDTAKIDAAHLQMLLESLSLSVTQRQVRTLEFCCLSLLQMPSILKTSLDVDVHDPSSGDPSLKAQASPMERKKSKKRRFFRKRHERAKARKLNEQVNAKSARLASSASVSIKTLAVRLAIEPENSVSQKRLNEPDIGSLTSAIQTVPVCLVVCNGVSVSRIGPHALLARLPDVDGLTQFQEAARGWFDQVIHIVDPSKPNWGQATLLGTVQTLLVTGDLPDLTHESDVRGSPLSDMPLCGALPLDIEDDEDGGLLTPINKALLLSPAKVSDDEEAKRPMISFVVISMQPNNEIPRPLASTDFPVTPPTAAFVDVQPVEVHGNIPVLNNLLQLIAAVPSKLPAKNIDRFRAVMLNRATEDDHDLPAALNVKIAPARISLPLTSDAANETACQIVIQVDQTTITNTPALVDNMEKYGRLEPFYRSRLFVAKGSFPCDSDFNATVPNQQNTAIDPSERVGDLIIGIMGLRMTSRHVSLYGRGEEERSLMAAVNLGVCLRYPDDAEEPEAVPNMAFINVDGALHLSLMASEAGHLARSAEHIKRAPLVPLLDAVTKYMTEEDSHEMKMHESSSDSTHRPMQTMVHIATCTVGLANAEGTDFLAVELSKAGLLVRSDAAQTNIGILADGIDIHAADVSESSEKNREAKMSTADIPPLAARITVAKSGLQGQLATAKAKIERRRLLKQLQDAQTKDGKTSRRLMASRMSVLSLDSASNHTLEHEPKRHVLVSTTSSMDDDDESVDDDAVSVDESDFKEDDFIEIDSSEQTGLLPPWMQARQFVNQVPPSVAERARPTDIASFLQSPQFKLMQRLVLLPAIASSQSQDSGMQSSTTPVKLEHLQWPLGAPSSPPLIRLQMNGLQPRLSAMSLRELKLFGASTNSGRSDAGSSSSKRPPGLFPVLPNLDVSLIDTRLVLLNTDVLQFLPKFLPRFHTQMQDDSTVAVLVPNLFVHSDDQGVIKIEGSGTPTSNAASKRQPPDEETQLAQLRRDLLEARSQLSQAQVTIERLRRGSTAQAHGPAAVAGPTLPCKRPSDMHAGKARALEAEPRNLLPNERLDEQTRFILSLVAEKL